MPNMSLKKNAMPTQDASSTTLPTRATLRRRFNPVWQLFRGAALMMRIMRMVIKGHSGH